MARAALSAAELARYEQDGYLLLPGPLSAPELDEAEDAFDRLIQV